MSDAITLHGLSTPRLYVHYRQHGDLDGMPMVLVHGSFGSGRWWELFMLELPPQIRAIAPDLRGVGGTERSSTGYAIADQAGDLAALVDALELAEIELVGHSSGGAIAIEYALTHPDRVRTLTLVDTAPLEGVVTPLETYVLLDRMRTDRSLLEEALRTLMPSLDVSDANPAGRALFKLLVDDAQAMHHAAFTAVADALNQWNRFDDGGALRLPTLLIWGDQDVIVERDAMTRTLIAIPGANNLDVLRGVGHSPMLEAPAALAARIVDFITEEFADFDAVRHRAIDESMEDTAEATPDDTTNDNARAGDGQ